MRATQKSAETAERQLQLAERPWLAIEAARVEKVEYPNGPDGPGDPRISLQYDVVNVGHGVAILQGVFSELIPEAKGKGFIDRSITRMCDERTIRQVNKGDERRYGIIAGPPTPFNYRPTDVIGNEGYGLKLRDPSPFRNSGCILYESMADPNHHKIHHTPFTAMLVMKDGKPFKFSDRPLAADILVSDIRIIANPVPVD